MVSESFEKQRPGGNLPYSGERGNLHGESMMIDVSHA
jgi:hypothetical protein